MSEASSQFSVLSAGCQRSAVSSQLQRATGEQTLATGKRQLETGFLAIGHCPLATGFFLRWLKFNFVGGLGIAVQLAALALFRSVLHWNYLLATALAVETAVLHNFLWHERFTWADRPSARWTLSLARFARFNVSNGAVSIVGNLLLMRLLVGQFHLNYLAANLIAIAICSLVNFLLSDRFVFQTEM